MATSAPNLSAWLKPPRRQLHAVDPGREAEIVLDARRRAGLAAKGARVEYHHRQPLRGRVHGRGAARRPCTDHGHVIELVEVEVREDAETGRGLAFIRAPQHLAVGTEHHRKLVGGDTSAVEQRTRLLILLGIENRVGVTVPGEEAFDARKIRVSGRSNQRRPGLPLVNKPNPAKNEGAHHDLADLRRADHQRAHMCIVERNRRSAVGTGLSHGERLTARELTELAGKLSGVMRRYVRFNTTTVATNRVDAALEHEPGRHVPFADSEHGLARSEIPRRAAGKALCRLDLSGIEHGKHLVAAGLDQTHDSSPTEPLLTRSPSAGAAELRSESQARLESGFKNLKVDLDHHRFAAMSLSSFSDSSPYITSTPWSMRSVPAISTAWRT